MNNNNNTNLEESKLSWKGLDMETKVAIIVISVILLAIFSYNIYTRAGTR